jgi:ribonuclease PH
MRAAVLAAVVAIVAAGVPVDVMVRACSGKVEG